MIIRQTCVSMVMVSGILLFAGCAFVNYDPHERAQFDSTLGSQSTSLAGSYSDVGSDGSIKPHPESSYKMSQEPRSTEGTTPRSGSGSNRTGSSSGATGADGQ